ncbi:hypothetical protein [Thauera phenolivorans]|uniref:hypothetical protein n=1 Tax=Thauera phenolivorans TaxID=1792543 RepID=UPI00083AD48C|nr:hypothetical protein [Thauera phenolivorans]
MLAENLSYALVQVAHNFGAAAVVGVPLIALASGRSDFDHGGRRLLWLVLLAWAVQALSGAAFATVSYALYGRLPDISRVATIALGIKLGCAMLGFALAALRLRAGVGREVERDRRLWGGLFALGAVALTAAAFLRWFS